MLEVKLTANCGRYRQGKEVHACEGRTLVQRFGSGVSGPLLLGPLGRRNETTTLRHTNVEFPIPSFAHFRDEVQ